MSIINDALKKVQEKLKKTENAAVPPPVQPPTPSQPVSPTPPTPTGPTPTFTPAGPLPSNPASPVYHQSGKPVFPPTTPTPPRTAFPSATPKPQPAATTTPERKSNKTALLVFIFIVLGGVALFMYREQVKPLIKGFAPNTKKPKRLAYSKTELIPVTETKQPATDTVTSVNPEIPQEEIKLPQNLKLNGTVVMGSKTIALINGNIQEVGSQIQGFTVIDISIKKVILEKNGQKFELVVKNEF